MRIRNCFVFRVLEFGFFSYMRKNVFGKKLKRTKNERSALFKSLMSSLVLNESIKTTEAKAKAIKPEIEKLVTKAKNVEKGAKGVLHKSLSKEAFDKIIKEIGPRFAKRNGGYTRIIKLGERFGDNSPLVLIEWVEKADKASLEAAVISKKEKVVKDKKVEKKVKETKKVEKKPVKKTAKKETKKTK